MNPDSSFAPGPAEFRHIRLIVALDSAEMAMKALWAAQVRSNHDWLTAHSDTGACFGPDYDRMLTHAMDVAEGEDASLAETSEITRLGINAVVTNWHEQIPASTVELMEEFVERRDELLDTIVRWLAAFGALAEHDTDSQQAAARAKDRPRSSSRPAGAGLRRRPRKGRGGRRR